MTHQVFLNNCMPLMRRLAQNSRIQHQVCSNEMIAPYVEQDYNLKIIYDHNVLLKNVNERSESMVIFDSEADYTLLMLKYL